ncbi:hypothetical protein C8Q74DRAFT_189897 [Fomes fomentarius]|nr:hypothetical protein C8Q74DRAFT_189897 [Fomes fomentarius]
MRHPSPRWVSEFVSPCPARHGVWLELDVPRSTVDGRGSCRCAGGPRAAWGGVREQAVHDTETARVQRTVGKDQAWHVSRQVDRTGTERRRSRSLVLGQDLCGPQLRLRRGRRQKVPSLDTPFPVRRIPSTQLDRLGRRLDTRGSVEGNHRSRQAASVRRCWRKWLLGDLKEARPGEHHLKLESLNGRHTSRRPGRVPTFYFHAHTSSSRAAHKAQAPRIAACVPIFPENQ